MNKTFLKITLIVAGVASSNIASTGAMAQEAKPATELSFNAALTSDYRFRGISQTRLRPALQGGADIIHNPSGLYAGAWASTIRWTDDAGGDGNVEIDLYAGLRGALTQGILYDTGVLRYVYPDNRLSGVPGFVGANTTELYAQIGYGPASLKYSHSVTNLFGFVDSKNSGYLDLTANFEAGKGFVINTHAGHQRVANNSAASYTDWKLGVTKDLGFATTALAVIGTNADKTAYASPANGKFLGKSALVLTVSKTF